MMTQTQSIYRLNPANQYAMLSNQATQNTELSNLAFRFHIHMITLPEDFKIYQDYLSKTFGVSIRTVQIYINELKAAGLMEYIKTGKGRTASDGYYVVYEIPKAEMMAIRTIEIVGLTAANEDTPPDPELKEPEAQPEQTDFNQEKATIYAQCLVRLERVFNLLSPAEKEQSELAYEDFVNTLTTKYIRVNAAFAWMVTAIKASRNKDERITNIETAKDRKADAVVVAINTQTAKIIKSTGKAQGRTHLEMMEEDAWMEG